MLCSRPPCGALLHQVLSFPGREDVQPQGGEDPHPSNRVPRPPGEDPHPNNRVPPPPEEDPHPSHPTPPPPLFVKHACERDVLNLTCPELDQIFITTAYYGRKSDEHCPKSNGRKHCGSEDNAKHLVTTLCQGKPSCQVTSPRPGSSQHLLLLWTTLVLVQFATK